MSQRSDNLIYAEPVRIRSCWEKFFSFGFVTVLFIMDELCLATVLIYDFKRILAGDTRIRQNEVKISLTILLSIKNILSIWSTVLFARGVWTVRTILRNRFRELLLNEWVLLVHICLIVLCQASILTQFSVMMFFFWSKKVSKDWVH